MNDRATPSIRPPFLLIAASFVVFVAGLRAAGSIVVPFLLAVFISIIATPLFFWLQKKKIPSGFALLIMVGLLVLVGGVTINLVGSSLSGFSENLPRYQTQLQQQQDAFFRWLEAKGLETPSDMRQVINAQSILRFAGSLAGNLSGVLSNAFLILLTIVFILLEATTFPAKLAALPGRARQSAAVLNRLVDNVRKYVVIKTGTSILTGFLIGLWLKIMNVDYPVLWGVLAFFLNYVPNIGSIIAAIPALLLALIEFGLGGAAWAGAGYLVVNIAIGSFLEPKIMGAGLGLSSLVVFMSLVFWGWVLGPVGMILSVPLTMATKLALESSDQTRWLAILMGGRPAAVTPSSTPDPFRPRRRYRPRPQRRNQPNRPPRGDQRKHD